MPRRSSRCGSHIHVSPGRGEFSLRELKAIAFAVIWYDQEVQRILHRCRRDCDYCRRNIAHSRELRNESIDTIASMINEVSDKSSLVGMIQGWEGNDRRTLWNFQNVTSKPGSQKPAIGTVEFRGGRCLRGKVRTKRWIAFAIAFVILAIKRYSTRAEKRRSSHANTQQFPLPIRNTYPRTSLLEFWKRLRAAAAQECMIEYLTEK